MSRMRLSQVRYLVAQADRLEVHVGVNTKCALVGQQRLRTADDRITRWDEREIPVRDVDRVSLHVIVVEQFVHIAGDAPAIGAHANAHIDIPVCQNFKDVLKGGEAAGLVTALSVDKPLRPTA